jgi:hypothetical protein
LTKRSAMGIRNMCLEAAIRSDFDQQFHGYTTPVPAPQAATSAPLGSMECAWSIPPAHCGPHNTMRPQSTQQVRGYGTAGGFGAPRWVRRFCGIASADMESPK